VLCHTIFLNDGFMAAKVYRTNYTKPPIKLDGL